MSKNQLNFIMKKIKTKLKRFILKGKYFRSTWIFKEAYKKKK